MSAPYHEKPLSRQDEAFEQMLEESLSEAADTELTPEKRSRRREEADNRPLAFAKIYYPGIFDLPWADLHDHIASLEEGGKHSISGFRESGKSALTYVVHAIRRIALGRDGMIGVVLRTQDKAEARTASLSRLILRNRRLCYDYDVEVQQDKAGYHIINGVHLVAGSVNTGLRAYVDDAFNRFGVLIGDDLYDKETVRSEMDNQRVYEFVTDEMWGQLEDWGLCVVLGNKINEDAPICKLEDNYPEGHYSFPIREGGDPNGAPTWPEKYDEENIRQMEKEIPADVWHGQYLDEPLVTGDVFDPEDIRFIVVRPIEVRTSITAVDPARGESPQACLKAASTLGLLDDGEVVMLGLRIRKEGYEPFFDWLRLEHQRRPAHRVILFENDFAQWDYARPFYQSWREKRSAVLPIQMHLASNLSTQHRAADKESRIMNLVHPHTMGQFHYHESLEGTRDFEAYKKQYRAFGEHGDDSIDGLDATATAYIQIGRFKGGGRAKGLTKKQHKRPSWDGGFTGWR